MRGVVRYVTFSVSFADTGHLWSDRNADQNHEEIASPKRPLLAVSAISGHAVLRVSYNCSTIQSGTRSCEIAYGSSRPKVEFEQIVINDTNFALAILRGQPLARGQFTAAEMQQKLDSME